MNAIKRLNAASLPALACALVLAGGVPVHSAAAQDSAQDDSSVEDTAEDSAGLITVTGSRIKRDPNATAPLPITTLTNEDFRNFGATDPTAALRQIPALIA